jgi:hypothetical protein
LRARHYGAEEVDLRKFEFTETLLACIPKGVARQCRALPVFDGPGSLKVAVADPSAIRSIDLLRTCISRDLEVCVADERQLDEFIDRLYSPGIG